MSRKIVVAIVVISLTGSTMAQAPMGLWVSAISP